MFTCNRIEKVSNDVFKYKKRAAVIFGITQLATFASITDIDAKRNLNVVLRSPCYVLFMAYDKDILKISNYLQMCFFRLYRFTFFLETYSNMVMNFRRIYLLK